MDLTDLRAATSAADFLIDEDESSNDKNEDDESSVFSYPDDRSVWDSLSDVSESNNNHTTTFGGEEWAEQEARFRQRSRLLFKVSQEISDTGVEKLLWEREFHMRKLERRRFLLSRALEVHRAENQEGNSSSSSSHDSMVTGPVHQPTSVHFSQQENQQEREDEQEDNIEGYFMDAICFEGFDSGDSSSCIPPVLGKYYSLLLFEWNTTVPTFCNAFLFVWGSIAMERVVFHLYKGIPQWMREEESSNYTPLIFHVVLGLLGCLLFFFTETLFSWFAPYYIYQCFKLDLENRLKLGHKRARIVAWVQSCPYRSILAYMIGHALIIEATMFFDEKVYRLWSGSFSHWTLLFTYCFGVILVSSWMLSRRGFQL